MRRKAAIAIAAFAVLTGTVYGLYCYYFPMGIAHRCDALLFLALQEYADKHGGAFPAGEATPEASISLVHSLDEYGYEYAYLLRRRDVSEDVVRQMLQRGQLLDPETCGWNYVEGLRKNSNPKLALFWDKEGLGHHGGRLSDGGHVVTFVSGSREHIAAARWGAFLAEQQRFFATEKRGQLRTKATLGGEPPQGAAAQH